MFRGATCWAGARNTTPTLSSLTLRRSKVVSHAARASHALALALALARLSLRTASQGPLHCGHPSLPRPPRHPHTTTPPLAPQFT